MTYEQSLQNIEQLINFIWPLNFNSRVCFNFTSEIAFDVLYYANEPGIEEQLMAAISKEKGFPCAEVNYNKCDHTIFFYYDENIMFYEINFTTGEIRCDLAESLRFCPLRSRQGMRALAEMFERMKLPEDD